MTLRPEQIDRILGLFAEGHGISAVVSITRHGYETVAKYAPNRRVVRARRMRATAAIRRRQKVPPRVAELRDALLACYDINRPFDQDRTALIVQQLQEELADERHQQKITDHGPRLARSDGTSHRARAEHHAREVVHARSRRMEARVDHAQE